MPEEPRLMAFLGQRASPFPDYLPVNALLRVLEAGLAFSWDCRYSLK